LTASDVVEVPSRLAAWSGTMLVVRHPRPLTRVCSEMTAFLTWFNASADTDPVLKAAMAHLWFVTIHPFDDGNGRIARAVAYMALAL
jgi:Fic family protein